MNKVKILSALMTIAIVATPAIGGKSNYDSNVHNYQIIANAAKQTGWVESKGNWYYYDKNGKMIKDKKKKIDGYYYYFDQKGRMLEGQWHGKNYFFNESGVMVTGCAPTDLNKWCNFDSNGNLIESKGVAYLLTCKQNIYSSTSTNSKIKGKLKKGELVFITDLTKKNTGEIWGKINYEGKVKGYFLVTDSKGKNSGNSYSQDCFNAAFYKFAIMKHFEDVIHNDVGPDEFIEVNYIL